MKKSLGNRLLLILITLTLFVWMSVSAVIWVLGSAAIQRQIDEQLRIVVTTVGFTINAFISAGFPSEQKGTLLDYQIVKSGDGTVYLVRIPEDTLPIILNVWWGHILQAKTEGAPLFEPPHTAGIADNTLTDGSQWRVIRSRLGETDLWLIAGLNQAVYRSESNRLLLAILSPLLLGLLLMVPLIYYSVRNGLQPLRNLEQQISQRSSADLHAVTTTDVPAEVAPVVSALNRLLEQLSVTIEKEKRITADAAHELQTPLAAIKTEVQLALSTASAEHRTLLHRIIERVNRASHAVQQLTALSRLETTAQAFTARVDLYSIVKQVLESHRHQLSQRKLTVTVNDCHPVINGSADMIRILIDNLIRNALNHAIEGTTVAIRLSAQGIAKFLIENQCQALSEQEWELITQRFYRVPGSRGSGSGLGMSIAQRICELHGATFAVGKCASGDGFAVNIEFPAVVSTR